MDPRISRFGNELLTDAAANKPLKAGRPAALAPSDLQFINTNRDNKITLDELKVALAQKQGVALETMSFLPEEEAELAEDARDLTSFIRQRGKLEGTPEQGFAYVAANKQPTLAVVRGSDHHENPVSLGMGAKGDDIRKVHVLLNNLHAHTEGYERLDERNETFDQATHDAIANFQQKYNLLGGTGSTTTAGVIDGRTLRALEREVEAVIKIPDIYTPFIAVADLPGVPDDDPKRLAALQKFTEQLAEKGLTSEEIEMAFHTAHDLADFSIEAIRKVETKIKGGSDSFCYTGVKEALEGALNYRYQAFGGKGGSWASTADTNLFQKRPDLFAQLEVSREELNYLPHGAIVVYEPGGVGHIGIKSYDQAGKQLDLSDRVRTGRPYPNANYKVFLPLKPTPETDRNYATPAEAADLSRLEYAARQTQARRRR